MNTATALQPVLAIVGRPNVGKSTLFNRLTRSRDALVADFPGLTRDRQYGTLRLLEKPVVLVDTGGLSGEKAGVDPLMEKQVRLAIEEADGILFVVDGFAGLTPADEVIAQDLRAYGKPIFLLVNKADTGDSQLLKAEFMPLGFEAVFAISAAQGKGVRSAFEQILEHLGLDRLAVNEEAETEKGIKVAVIGRPNVGKSTLINRMIGEERLVAFDMPGTTRDAIEVPFEKNGQKYTLIDTAGVRKKSKIDQAIEKFSVIKAMQAMEMAHVVILVVDSQIGITDQDVTLLGLALEAGRGLIIAFNKWDHLDTDQKRQVLLDMETRIQFADYAIQHKISALEGTGVGLLFKSIDHIYQSALQDLSTPDLTRVLEGAVMAHQPPLVGGHRVKLKYAHAGGKNPPRIIIHGTRVNKLPADYKRYLANVFRKAFGFEGTPVFVEFRAGENPYAGRKRTLNPKAQARKRRHIQNLKAYEARKKRNRRLKKVKGYK